MRVVFAAVLAAAFPGSALGAGLVQARDLQPQAPRTVVAQRSFQLVGLHWRGTGRVEFRTRGRSGSWSSWRQSSDEDTPPHRGWRIGEPVWVGASTALQYRAVGRVARARAYLVRSPRLPVTAKRIELAGAPAIIPRSGWHADESIRKGAPFYADGVHLVFVHHTVNSNSYTKAQSASIVRGIELYHVKSNGWNDIGYNFLVDKYGQIFEGRYGGITKPVVGAHTMGFNTGSVGIAMIGDFGSTSITPAARAALVSLIAWRLDLAHVDPLSTVNAISSGNERFNPGIPVLLRAISGHRDTGLTECPGQRLYEMLPAITKRVAALGLPKLYAPLAAPDEGGGVRFTARLSSAGGWRVMVTDPSGAELGSGGGTGTTVDWTWRPPGPIPAGARWRIEAPGATPAVGTLGTQATTAFQIAATSAGPVTLTPNGDGQGDTADVGFTLTADANVGADVVDGTGTVVTTAAPLRWRRAGERTVTVAGQSLADGSYTLRLTAKATGDRIATVDIPLLVTRTLGRVSLDATSFTPNGDGRGDTLTISVPLTGPASLTVRILRDGKWIATPLAGSFDAGTQTVTWDGTKRIGRARDGAYVVSVESADAVGTARVELPVLLDRTAPVVRVVSTSPAVLRVSEPAVLAVRANGAIRRITVAASGEVRVPWIARLRTLVVVARYEAGNRSVLRRR